METGTFSGRLLVFLALLTVVSQAAGCGKTLSCAVSGDNVRGRVRFISSIPVDTTTKLLVEWSNNGFSAVSGRSVLDNIHGLPDVPYSLCADTDVPLVFRAYQDHSGSMSFSSGDPSGRYDGTADGNAAYISKTIPSASSSSSSSDSRPPWNTIDAIDITIDTP